MFSHSGTPLYGHPYITDSFVVPRGEGDSAYERGGDARRKFWIKPLKKTDLGVVQAQLFFTPKRDHVKTQTNEKTLIIWME